MTLEKIFKIIYNKENNLLCNVAFTGFEFGEETRKLNIDAYFTAADTFYFCVDYFIFI
jgi:hypothetical protein